MEILRDHALPIAGFLLLILLCYAAEFLLKRRYLKKTPGADSIHPTGGLAVATTAVSVAAVLLNVGLAVYILVAGGGIEEILPVLLLSLFGAML